MHPRYIDLESIQTIHSFGKVVDVAMIVERSFLDAKRGIQTQTRSQSSSSYQSYVPFIVDLKERGSKSGRVKVG